MNHATVLIYTFSLSQRNTFSSYPTFHTTPTSSTFPNLEALQQYFHTNEPSHILAPVQLFMSHIFTLLFTKN